MNLKNNKKYIKELESANSDLKRQVDKFIKSKNLGKDISKSSNLKLMF